MPIGQTSNVSVTVTDTVNYTAQLVFVGLRFEWAPPNSFFVGDNSEKGAVLTDGEQITYTIPVGVPANVTPGVHKLTAYVTYRILNQTNWTGVNAEYWVVNIQLAYPQNQQTQTATATPGPQQGFNVDTIGIILVVVALWLILERGRIKRLIRKSAGPTPTQPKGEPSLAGTPSTAENLPVSEKKEEDL